MADVTASRIVIDVSTNGASANATLEKLDTTINDLNETLKKQKKSTEDTSSALKSLSTIVKAVAVGFLVKEFIKLTDTYANVNNKLKLVTSSTEDLEKTQKRLFDLAQSSRSSYESTAELYARLSRSTKDLNVNQDDLLTVTDSINKAFIVSGASAEEASNAIRQLSQGLAAGALRGDEFNSVAEQAPRLQEAIAASLGVTVGELRALAAEGKITSEVIVNALKGQANTINNEFKQLTPTFGQLEQQFRNSLVAIVGGAGQKLLPVLKDVSELFNDLAKDGGELSMALDGVAVALFKIIQAAVVVIRNLIFLKEIIGVIPKAIQNMTNSIKGIENTTGITDNLAESFDKLNESTSRFLGLSGSTAENTAKASTAMNDMANNTKKNADAAKKWADTLKNGLTVLAGIGDVGSQIKLQEQAFKEQQATVKKAGLDTTALIQFQEKQRANLIKASLAESTNIENASYNEKLAALKSQYDEILNSDKLSYKDRESAHKAFVDQTRLLEQQRFQAFANNFELFAQGANDFMAIFQNLSTMRLNASSAEIARLEEEASTRQNLANQNIANLQMQGATTDEIAALEAQRDAENIASQEMIAQKRRELARKQAQDQKRFGRFSIILDTATAVTKALATIPPPASYALAALSAAKGASQLAVNESTPVPAAQFGGSFQVPPGNQADGGIMNVNQGEKVTVEPVRQSGNDSPKMMTLVIDGYSFKGYFIDSMNKFLNSGDVQVRRSGAIKTA